MAVLDLARWQFAVTTVYHFIFVPLTIGLAPIVAGFQTAWHFTGNPRWLRLTKFFGKLLLINFAIGVATGIVQEFQFGMNWSEYSRFVGDVFGAPLAMEALAAFFIESTFLGLWIFGWSRLPKRIHLACIWLVAIAVNLSAFFILAANAWMQHPVGAVFNPETGRAEMESIGAVLTNPVLRWAFPHTITAALVVAGTFVCAIGAWWMIRLARTRVPYLVELARDTYRPAVVVGSVVLLVAGVGLFASGDALGKELYRVQPAKMSAAEALCEGTEAAPFTPVAFGHECESVWRMVEVPYIASFLGTGSFTGPSSHLPGLNDVHSEMTARFGDVTAAGEPVNYRPPLMITFWSFRLMMGLGVFSAALALIALWATRKGRVTESRALQRLALIALPMPFLACSFGWIFTEVGRQPWVVTPNPTGIDAVRLLTERGVSTVVPAPLVLGSMIGFTLLYGVLAVIWFGLLRRYVQEGVPQVIDDSTETQAENDADPAPTLSFAY